MRLIIGAAAMLAIASFCSSRPTPAEASEPYGCITYEDDSFVCGSLEPDREWSDTWGVDRSKPWISGCIPGGYCDSPDSLSPAVEVHQPEEHDID